MYFLPGVSGVKTVFLIVVPIYFNLSTYVTYEYHK